MPMTIEEQGARLGAHRERCNKLRVLKDAVADHAKGRVHLDFYNLSTGRSDGNLPDALRATVQALLDAYVVTEAAAIEAERKAIEDSVLGPVAQTETRF